MSGVQTETGTENLWDDRNSEWAGEIPERTDVSAGKNGVTVDRQRSMWRNKIEAALASLRRDEARDRQKIMEGYALNPERKN